MEKTPVEEKVAPKHAKLATEEEGKKEEVEIVDNKYAANLVSPFLNQLKSWENEDDFSIPDDILENIKNELGFIKPSQIQSVSIPMISKEPYHSLIAQARNGSGKTVAFAIGSTLRVDRSLKKTQVLVITNTRELCKQVYDVYAMICKGTDISVEILENYKQSAQILVAVHGKVENFVSGRQTLDLKDLKAIVIDEADLFFLDNDVNFKVMERLAGCKDIKGRTNIQWVLFSATYSQNDQVRFENIQKRMAQIVGPAQQIKLKPENLKLNHIKQYYMKCEDGKKLDFIKTIFDAAETTQTFIFVNTKDFAVKVHERLRKAGFKSFLMFSGMTKEERDDTIEKFRRVEVNVLITTNMIARGIDVPQTELVINFDVPQMSIGKNGKKQADADTYMHRIGRAGRFGKPGIALTIFDRKIDEEHFNEIVNSYKMKDLVQELESPQQLKELLEALN